MKQDKTALLERLNKYGQQSLLTFWDQLSSEEQSQFAEQLAAVDFDMLTSAHSDSKNADAPEADESRPDRAIAPRTVIRQPRSEADRHAWQQAVSAGEEALRNDRCAVITVAGGQGTRLGFELPKGMFPIGPISNRTLFQIFAEQIQALRTKYECSLPWLIMTSAATDEDTRNYFESENYFGLSPESVSFFCQASLPAMDAQSGKLLLAAPGSLSLSPDGHGGLVSALQKSGLLKQLAERDIDFLYYHQVDNPTVRICEPSFVGFHLQKESQMTTLVVRKTSEGRWWNAFLIPHEDRYFIHNEQGELIIARLDGEGYHEVSRSLLVEPTRRVQRRMTIWSHPAFAMKSVFARNDRELVRVDLSRR